MSLYLGYLPNRSKKKKKSASLTPFSLFNYLAAYLSLPKWSVTLIQKEVKLIVENCEIEVKLLVENCETVCFLVTPLWFKH